MRRETQNIVLFLVGFALASIAVTGVYTRYVKPGSLPWLMVSAAALMALALSWLVLDRLHDAVEPRMRAAARDCAQQTADDEAGIITVLAARAAAAFIDPLFAFKHRRGRGIGHWRRIGRVGLRSIALRRVSLRGGGRRLEAVSPRQEVPDACADTAGTHTLRPLLVTSCRAWPLHAPSLPAWPPSPGREHPPA